MSQVITLQDLKNKEQEANKQLQINLNKLTNDFINTNFPDKEDSRDLINETLNDSSHPNYESLNNLKSARNDILKVYTEVFKDQPLYLELVGKLISNITLQGCDLIVRNDVIEALNNSLELSEAQKDYIKQELINKTNNTLENVELSMDNNIDISKYKNKPNKLKDILRKHYNNKAN
jgi:bacterioferritin (cytochrome b1)